jgi:hypothetical protein
MVRLSFSLLREAAGTTGTPQSLRQTCSHSTRLGRLRRGGDRLTGDGETRTRENFVTKKELQAEAAMSQASLGELSALHEGCPHPTATPLAARDSQQPCNLSPSPTASHHSLSPPSNSNVAPPHSLFSSSSSNPAILHPFSIQRSTTVASPWASTTATATVQANSGLKGQMAQQ